MTLVEALHSRSALQRGFTLIELLIVILIVANLIAVVSLGVSGTQERLFQQDAQKLAHVLMAARQEAQVRSQNVRVILDNTGFGFEMREQQGWRQLERDDLLKRRSWSQPLARVRLESTDGSPYIVFGRESIDPPFRLILTNQNQQVQVIDSNGLGVFDVRQGFDETEQR